MGERIGSLNRGLLKSCFGIFIAILLGLATSFITSGGPTLASIKSAGPEPAPAVVLFKGAGPCGDKSKRYSDCGNGTVTDTATGLIWLKKVDCFSTSNWDDAKKAAAGLKSGDCGLTDGSAPGEWRLPTSKEWEDTMAKAKDLKCSGPVLTNDAGTACLTAGPSSFGDVEADYYWSSTMEGATVAFGDIDHGNILKGNSINMLRMWPVRGGQ